MVFTVSPSGLAVVVVAVVVVVVDCPRLWPLSLDLDLSLGLLVPAGRRETCISPFASTPVISPLPSSSPFPFSSPLLLSSPLFFFPLPLPPLPPALEVTVISLFPPSCVVVVVSASMRTQVSLLDVVILCVALEAVDICHSEFSKLLVLSVPIELWEAAEVEGRRVGDCSLAGVEFSLVGPLNHELPQENKPAGGTKHRKRKKQGGSEHNHPRENNASKE